MKKSIPLTALLGAAPMAALLGAGTMVATTDASAAPVAATLVSVASYSANGSSVVQPVGLDRHLDLRLGPRASQRSPAAPTTVKC